MNGEILRLVDTIHRDKDIDKEIIFQGVEACIVTAVKKKVGEETDVRVTIDRETGETTVFEGETVVPISDLGRLAALQGKQVLFQKIREAERDKVFAEYEHRLDKLVTGVVQRSENSNLIVNLGSGKTEGFLPRSHQVPGEKFRVGERIKVLVQDVKKNHRVKITLSRTSPAFVKALFELEVPEIAEKVIEIMDIVREPGYRTKIAVTTYDSNVDCVGACVGVRGSRIKNIVDELFGEKIDIVRWNESVEVLIMNALKPAEITSMDLDYENTRAKVYVRSDQQSLAIGKNGQNVRLASKLAKWDLDIVKVSEEDIEKLRQGETISESEGGDTETAAGAGEAAADGADASSAGEAGSEPSGAAATPEDQESETETSETATSETETSETETSETATSTDSTDDENATAMENADAVVSGTEAPAHELDAGTEADATPSETPTSSDELREPSEPAPTNEASSSGPFSDANDDDTAAAPSEAAPAESVGANNDAPVVDAATAKKEPGETPL